ncbi:uncharacterized protein BP01DRAFT_120627 [Aspergillus saccharolyticus JOP 1030-1]|uniref:Uncharacterized protein n=1 Tax=Aspergillus saccharolyticus JOP 1030-1 TaxID=1450539 RepID=A0A318ZY12_9EURO|nr:hypothetical protein BP01DRAFT_120627 [Aspergillus saccharolyticus JOP 1030-1]PYH49080.1 hypothetical protein BP01DRAFT_120627 [Aspergillus saccharolyticus JOP 1030-1]
MHTPFSIRIPSLGLPKLHLARFSSFITSIASASCSNLFACCCIFSFSYSPFSTQSNDADFIFCRCGVRRCCPFHVFPLPHFTF